MFAIFIFSRNHMSLKDMAKRGLLGQAEEEAIRLAGEVVINL
jgi:hypothetical protein